ncbi:hypothetical protein GF318_05200 [Candidatus Micrarchaeota archaeon]|nr:hypothetical protein [Candidatus Micrarchaeota archaeon]
MPTDKTRQQVIRDSTRMIKSLNLRRFICSYSPGRLKRMNGQKPAFGIEAAVLSHIDREERKRAGRPPRRIEAIMLFIRHRTKVEDKCGRDTVSMNDVPTRKGTPFDGVPPASEDIIASCRKVTSSDAVSHQD